MSAKPAKSLSNLAERAVGAILKAAAIQAERLSRRVRRLAPTEEAQGGNYTARASGSRLVER
jgi:hypothetical protein